MGLDGFSMGNLGLNADMTSAQMMTQAEHIARKESEIIIKDVTQLAEDGGVKRKKEESEGQNQEFEDGFKKKDDSEENESEKGDSSKIINFEERDPKEFSVRINSQTEEVELYSKKNDRVIETIQADELMHLVSKLDSASGILVNRKI